MAWDINQVVVFGRLTRDPELSYTKSNKAVCKFSIANGRGQQGSDEVNFFDTTVWDKQAQSCAQYLKKGSPVIVAGRLRQERWKNEAGQTRAKVEIVATSIQFVSTASGNSQGSSQQATQAPKQTPTQNSYQQANPSSPNPESIDFENFGKNDFANNDMGDGDVPF